MQNRDREQNEKIEALKNAKNLQDKDLLIDVDKAIKLTERRGRFPMMYRKPFDYAATEQYKLNREQKPDNSPGPQYYWKMKKGEFDSNSVPKVRSEEMELNGKTVKVHYMNHRRTDFRTYKPMRTSIY